MWQDGLDGLHRQINGSAEMGDASKPMPLFFGETDFGKGIMDLLKVFKYR